MPLKIGDIDKYIVIKETDIAYTLKSKYDDTEIFMHFNQATKRLNIGDEVDAFLYYDQKKRLCATMETPLITKNKAGFCKVVDKSNMGLFININIAKDILVSSDFLPRNTSMWPNIGDEIPCIIRQKTDQLVAKIISNTDIVEKEKLNIGDFVDATVYRINDEGICLVSKNFNLIFVHKTNTRKKYRLGEIVNVKVIHINEKNTYTATTLKNKEIVRLDDSDMILNHLKNHGGSLALTDKSSPEEILRYFNLSKSAFKRAIGNLYRERLITMHDGYIKLNEK